MPFIPKFVDLVRNVASVTGTGPVTLGQAVSGYSSLAAAVSTGDQFYYCIQGVDKPAEREVGRGTMQADGKVARQPIAGAATDFTGGAKTIALVAAAEWFARIDQAGAGSMGAAADRAELAGKDGAATGRMFLAEAGREGSFVFDPSNLSAVVAADPGQGLYVAPVSDPTGASGAWVRKFDGAVNVKWFGAKGDGITDDGPAFAVALALLKLLAVNDDVYYKGSSRLYVPAGHYFLGTTTLDIGHTLIIEGDSGVGGGISTLLRWAADTTGIRIQSFNTNGSSGTDGAPYHYAGAGTLIRNIALKGGYAGVEGEYHGIHARAGFTLENFWIDNFQGDGIHANTTAAGGGALEGNSNNSAIRRGRITNVRNGMFVDGADANVWLIESVDVTYARQWGYWDSSFLGNTGINIHTANCGVGPWTGLPATVVACGGNRYYVKHGQAGWCSANAPSGTTEDNPGWGHLAAGADDAALNIPAWSNGLSVREGGGFKTDSINARNQLIGCYAEGGQAPSQLVSPTLVTGGLWGSGIVNHDAGKEDPTIIAADGSLAVPNKAIFGNLFAGREVSTASIFTLHNTSPIVAGYRARQDFAVGFEADGITPAAMASIYAYSNTGNPVTAEGQIVFATRAYTTGIMTDRLQLDGANYALSPVTDLGLSLGGAVRRYSAIHVGAAGGLNVDGSKVIGAQGAALPADATDLASAIALTNAIKARMVAHGLVAA